MAKGRTLASCKSLGTRTLAGYFLVPSVARHATNSCGGIEMKTIRNSILCLTILLVAAPMLAAQELSKYHSFSLGAKLPTVLKLTERSLVDVTPTRGARFQELTWWPPSSPGRSVSS